MEYPNKDDVNAVGGTQPGVKSIDEISADISLEIDTSKSLFDVANKIYNSAEWHISAFTDTSRAPKYAVDPEISYYGNGSLSLLARAGNLIFSNNLNSANRSAFSVSQEDSSMYSSSTNTTLGSLKVDTVDGYELNGLSATFPSTQYSPTKAWVQKLFPTLSSKNLLRLAVLEAVQLGLSKILDNTSQSKETFESKDIAIIIQDNDIQEELFK